MVAKRQLSRFTVVSTLPVYSCDMATANSLKKFAEQAIQVERVLNEQRVAGSPGRVIYLLALGDSSVVLVAPFGANLPAKE